MFKWKVFAQTVSMLASLLAAIVLFAPLGLNQGIPEKTAAVILTIGGIVDLILLIARTPANNMAAKWVGALMMLSCAANFIGASILWFPLLDNITTAVKIAGVIAIADTAAEFVEIIFMKENK